MSMHIQTVLDYSKMCVMLNNYTGNIPFDDFKLAVIKENYENMTRKLIKYWVHC